MIQKGTLARLEAAKDCHVNSAAGLNPMAAGCDLRSQSIQLEFLDEGADAFKDAVILDHNSLLFHSVSMGKCSGWGQPLAADKLLSGTLPCHPLVAGDLPALPRCEFPSQLTHFTLQAFDLRGLGLVQPVAERLVLDERLRAKHVWQTQAPRFGVTLYR